MTKRGGGVESCLLDINMYEFIPVIRTDRYREIRAYKEKNFTFIKEKKFRLIDTIKINKSDKEKYKFEVRADFYDVKFYIIENNAAIYLTFFQLYELFKQVHLSGNIKVTYHLRQLLKRDKKEIFLYRGIEYKFTKIREFSLLHKVSIPNSGIQINYNELFYLLVLIQEKSNYLWSRSISEANKNFSNGIIRLIIVLLENKNGHEILNNLGWFMNDDGDGFKPNKLVELKKGTVNYKKHKELVKRKYYLTELEFGSIINLES